VRNGAVEHILYKRYKINSVRESPATLCFKGDGGVPLDSGDQGGTKRSNELYLQLCCAGTLEAHVERLREVCALFQ